MTMDQYQKDKIYVFCFKELIFLILLNLETYLFCWQLLNVNMWVNVFIITYKNNFKHVHEHIEILK